MRYADGALDCDGLQIELVQDNMCGCGGKVQDYHQAGDETGIYPPISKFGGCRALDAVEEQDEEAGIARLRSRRCCVVDICPLESGYA
jgi:hypothetical protein